MAAASTPKAPSGSPTPTTPACSASPRGASITDEIEPGSPVYACALGGADGRTLFACAAPDFFEEPRKAAREASLLAIQVTVPA